MVPRCLTIAGSDSSGGAGIQADLKTFPRLGCHGTRAVAAVTSQSTTRLTAVHEVPAEIGSEQLELLFCDLGADAMKTGMLVGRGTIEAVAGFLRSQPVPLVVDRVMAAVPWAPVPRARLSPRSSRASCRWRRSSRQTSMRRASSPGCRTRRTPTAARSPRRSTSSGRPAAVVAGEHRADSLDWLFDGERHLPIPVGRYRYAAKHGFGYTSSAALCTMLARGAGLEQAVRTAAAVATATVRNGFPDLGAADGPVDVRGIEALGAR